MVAAHGNLRDNSLHRMLVCLEEMRLEGDLR
jgi:hypothetical protein